MPIQPFEALRYNPKRVKIALVTAPPYDVISPTYQDQLYTRDERNVIRLELGKDFQMDDLSHNRYTRAKEFIENWLREGVLIQDPEPSVFVYEQEFVNPDTKKKMKRLAFFARLKTEEFGKGSVYPHEFTLSGPKADRLKLLATTKTNLSPIFGLYEDPRKNIRSLVLSMKSKHPLYSYQDDQGVHHHLWRETDPKKIKKLEKLFASKAIFIADGHHRFETAHNYFRSLENSAVSRREKERAEYTLAAFVALEDPGLAIFPTHRLVKAVEGFNPAAALEKMSALFEIKKIKTADLEKTLLKSKPNQYLLGFYVADQAYLLKLKSPLLLAKHMPKGKSKEWQKLDTSIAAELVLRPVFHVTEQNKEKHLAYTHYFEEAIEAVDKNEVQCAVLLRSTPLEVIKKICKLKQRMPQKSTYFYPKLASGLVFYRHEI
ncbi:MAG: DUF1015 domain-containing protein [Candidatus Omnitrophica bacterium]|nr:DUF1015 domain-containing protein [Candidatus Omnitrophota bacterium]